MAQTRLILFSLIVFISHLNAAMLSPLALVRVSKEKETNEEPTVKDFDRYNPIWLESAKRNDHTRRQLNHVLGIGIDVPQSQDTGGSYAHDSDQMAPWDQPSDDDDQYYYYYYYDPELDLPFRNRRKTARSSLDRRRQKQEFSKKNLGLLSVKSLKGRKVSAAKTSKTNVLDVLKKMKTGNRAVEKWNNMDEMDELVEEITKMTTKKN